MSLRLCAWIATYGSMTYARNKDFWSAERIWRDTVSKRPDNPRARLNYADVVTAKQSWSDIPTCVEAGLPIERYQMPRTVWLPKGVTGEQVAFYRAMLSKVRETGEWKEWLKRGSQTDAFLSGSELSDYIAADERWLRGQFAEDGWLVK